MAEVFKALIEHNPNRFDEKPPNSPTTPKTFKGKLTKRFKTLTGGATDALEELGEIRRRAGMEVIFDAGRAD